MLWETLLVYRRPKGFNYEEQKSSNLLRENPYVGVYTWRACLKQVYMYFNFTSIHWSNQINHFHLAARWTQKPGQPFNFICEQTSWYTNVDNWPQIFATISLKHLIELIIIYWFKNCFSYKYGHVLCPGLVNCANKVSKHLQMVRFIGTWNSIHKFNCLFLFTVNFLRDLKHNYVCVFLNILTL